MIDIVAALAAVLWTVAASLWPQIAEICSPVVSATFAAGALARSGLARGDGQ